MKKQLAVLLAFALVLPMTLGACGDKEKDERGKLDTRPVETMAPVQRETTAPTEEETTAPTGEETTAPTGEETTAPAEELTIAGQVEGNVYTNEYLGFGLELDDGWRFYSEEELQAVYGKTTDMMIGTEVGSAIQETQQFMDTLAESSDGLAAFNVGYEKVSMQERLVIQNLDEEELLDAIFLSSNEVLIRSYEQVGIKVETMEKVEVPFLGETGYGLKTVASIQGVPYYSLQFFFYDQDKYLATLTFNCFQEDATEDLAALCYPLD